MIASFFQHLEARGVDWLLISGQATILYGAATFSEDIDLWVEPTEQNFGRFMTALRDSGASYYRLTPPFEVSFAERHHGFHFVLPDPGGGADVYLDVMGVPPRVQSFELAARRSRFFETKWGRLRTVGIPDLVEIKKTQRPRDYPIISRLALSFVHELGERATTAELTWAVEHVFGASEFERLLVDAPRVATLELAPVLERASRELAAHGRWSEELVDALEDYFDEKMSILRKADRRFWSGVIDELRDLRSSGRLMFEGVPV
jgi:hypothetical protein